MESGIDRYIETFLILVIAITIHEFAHALSADRLGDPTPRSQGRISLNPIDHLDPFGTLFMLLSTFTGMGLGWGKPVMTRPESYKNPRWGMLAVAAWGPISNILQALVFAAVIHLNDARHLYPLGSMADALMQLGVQVNIGLFFFNLIPIPPLDGSKVFSALLPASMAQSYDRVMRSFGILLFVLLIVTRATDYIIGPETNQLFHFLADQR
jgi:Zn-dependent protease